MIALETQAPEEGAYSIALTFKDESGTALIPTTLTWTLTDEEGTVINSRSAVSLTPAATTNVVMYGADLSVTDTKKRRRIVTINGTYTSTYGTGLPLTEEIRFSIRDMLKVT